MNSLKTIVAMQLHDKIDFGLLKDKKGFWRAILLNVVKFVVVAAVAFLVLYFCKVLGIMYYSQIPEILNLLLLFILLLQIISCTIELMNTLFFASDNRVLITFPVTNDVIFFSKLIVYYLYQLKVNLTFFVPIAYAGGILMVMSGLCSPLVFLWMIIPLLFILMVSVVISGLLSIVAMYIKRLFRVAPILRIISFVAVLSVFVYIVVLLIGLIPDNIDLANQWDTIRTAVSGFLALVREKIGIFSNLIYILVGNKNNELVYVIDWKSLLGFAIVVGVDLVLIALNIFISRPLFFKLMSKNFETNKSNDLGKPNKVRGIFKTFLHKELIINIRSIEISVNYMITYVVVPILILFINSMYQAIDVGPRGEIFIYIFNVLLICLPMLASNALVATYYSREGRAGYIKRTKPVNAIYPLFAKLAFNIILSIPSMLASVLIYGFSVKFSALEIIFMFLGCILVHFGHMFYSASLDIRNPQNEQYATSGSEVSNPNENKSTIMAFIVSACYAVFSFILINECRLAGSNVPMFKGVFKLFIIAAIYFGCNLVIFISSIKAYFYDPERPTLKKGKNEL